MREAKIAELLNVGNRFMRSAHLERDFEDPSALSGYVLTDFARGCFDRVKNGLNPGSSQRAWRMTGDYGSGKSSFALLLAHAFADPSKTLDRRTRVALGFDRATPDCPNFVPVLVTCSRQALGASILTSLASALERLYPNGSRTKPAHKLRQMVEGGNIPTDDQVYNAILETNSRVIADSKGRGLLLILDELGKFLEFAALNSDRHDIFLLQRLAEAASGSQQRPLFVISLLHQGFNAYADQLNQSAQREWEKVAGRFEEIVFNQPAEQLASLIASAINVKTDGIPKQQAADLRRAMEDTIKLGWLGPVRPKPMSDLATGLYPLHPTVLPVLIRTFRRFGQNERSLFSFLLSDEPFGLQAFAERHVGCGNLYCLHNFYDYVRANFGHRLVVQSYRSHWSLIDSIIESFTADDECSIRVLKAVGILNLLDDGDLLPTRNTLACAIGGLDGSDKPSVSAALDDLHLRKRVIYDRGRSRGLCLWPHTSVDLEKAYDDARRAIAEPQRVADSIRGALESRPLVARRHYIETGNLRHYNVRYCSVPELVEASLDTDGAADGLIIVPLCETPRERGLALSHACGGLYKERPTCLVAVPEQLGRLASLVKEVQRWEWISTNTPELNADKFAREEVSRQKANARAQLDRRIQSILGFRQFVGKMGLRWFHQGRQQKIDNGRALLEFLSNICDRNYNLAPRIHNELVNRRSLSSAAAAARMRLIEALLLHPNSPALGMDITKTPPEMSMYLSVLKKTGLHQNRGDGWRVAEPDVKADAACNVRPVLEKIGRLVRGQPDSRINIAALFAELRKPPYGIRDGLIPLILTVFAVDNQKDVAFYKDGSFLRELTHEAMLVLTKAPERFDLQYCKIEGFRAETFHKLLTILEIEPSRDHHIELLDVVKNLCVFVAQLPAYVHNTKKLTETAIAVRDSILNARDPAKLLFNELPVACSLNPILPGSGSNDLINAFTLKLKSGLDDLRAAFPELQERMRMQLRSAFDLPGTFQQFRSALAARAEGVLLGVNEPRLRAFCLRLMDDNLPESDWLESLGSYLALKPPSKWHSVEENLFESELAQFAARFRRVESIAFAGGKTSKNAMGVRLAITQANGNEHEQVIHFAADEEPKLRGLQSQFESLLAQHHRLGLAAASRALWKSLERETEVTE